MQHVNFKPWVGSKYWQNNMFGRRVLVLGESHYAGAEDQEPDMTIKVVHRLAQNERHPFFTKTAKLLLDLDANTWLDDQRRTEVWEHVAFYNFVQQCPGDEPRLRPTIEMWEAATEPFLEVVADLKPQVVLVLGKELSHWIPELPATTTVCAVQHPSTAFDYEKWNPVFRKALTETTGHQNAPIPSAHGRFY